MLSRTLSAALLAIAGGPGLFAAITWGTKRVEARATPGQERFEAVFPFQNTGTSRVTIVSTESSCGCTAAKLDKFTYAPAESGVIRAIFEFGDRVGPQQKVVTVKTDDGENATHLVLRIDIPELVTLERDTLLWAVGAAIEPQSVIVHAARGTTMKELDFDAAAVTAEFAPLTNGGGYRVTLRPLNTAKPFRQVIRLHVDFAGKSRIVPLYLWVR